MKFIYCVILFILSFNAYGQEKLNFSIVAKGGINDWKADMDNSNSHKSELVQYIHGYDVNFGIGAQFQLLKKQFLFLNIEANYNQSTFQKNTDLTWTSFAPLDVDFDFKYVSKTLQFPIGIGLRAGKLSFVSGIVPTIYFKVRGDHQERYRRLEPVGEWEEMTLVFESNTQTNNEGFLADNYFRYMEKPIAFQSFIRTELNIGKFAFGFEYRHFLEDHYLVNEVHQYDVVGPYYEYFRQSRNAFNFVLLRRI
ncbi:MAG: hypothetical protein AAGK97_03825 [Bacteroidota bacterium]